MKYKIITYGCQMNVHESEKIAGMLIEAGFNESADIQQADIIVFNTCCIRDNAEKKILGHIGYVKKLKEKKPSLIVAVVGCMAQQDGMSAQLKKRYPFIDIIMGTSNLHKFSDNIQSVKKERNKVVDVIDLEKPKIIENHSVYRTSGTNAWLNIMYGCNNFCTYCIVPYVRGRERSRNVGDIIAEFRELIAGGYKEVTLLGQNVNSYGHDLGDGSNFADLLRKLSEIKGDHRIRFMTSHPKDLNDEVIDIIAESENICDNIHLPIQSGSNKILGLMNRHYTREYYLDTVEKIRKKIPNCGITTDIMVGFPYEEECDFEDTLDIVRRVKFSTAFTFIYSVRKGTKAAEMPQIPYEIKKDRIQRLIKEQNAVTRAYSRDYEGKTFKVLCEGTNEKSGDMVCGRTSCGRLVNFRGTSDMIGNYYDVKICRSQSATLYGEVID